MQLQRPFAAITPTVDGDVLGVLASTHTEHTASRLAELIPTRSLNGIRNAAERLVAHGTVVARDVGRVRTYALNDEHLFASELRAIARPTAALLDRMAEQVSRWASPPGFGAVFGSAARAEMREDSDIDILLVSPRGASDEWVSDVAALTHHVTAMTGNDARILDLEVDDLRSEAHAPLLRAVVNDGLVFAGSTTWLRRQLRKEAMT